MPTENRRVAAYLPKEIDERLSAFKSERGLKGDSSALITILSEFLGVSHQVTHQVGSDLVQRIEDLENKFSSLKSDLLSELDSRALLFNTSIVERLDEIEANLSIQRQGEVSRDELPSDLPVESLNKEVAQVMLGESLSVLPGELPTEKNVSIDVPIADPVVVKRKKGRPKSSGMRDDGTFSTAELARRFGVDRSTLSHLKPGGQREKSPDGMLKATREMDPEGIGWILIPEVNRFKPERDIASGSPQILQSELLNVEPLTQVNPLPEGSERSEEG